MSSVNQSQEFAMALSLVWQVCARQRRPQKGGTVACEGAGACGVSSATAPRAAGSCRAPQRVRCGVYVVSSARASRQTMAHRQASSINECLNGVARRGAGRRVGAW